MAIRTNPTGTSRQDNTKEVVGNTGDPLDQESGSGKPVMRRGGDESNSDIDVGTTSSQVDLSNGDFDSGTKNAGGAEALAGKLVSDSSETFSVEVKWLDDNENTTIKATPSALTDVTDVEFNLIMRSDRFDVKVTDTSGNSPNNVHGSINAH